MEDCTDNITAERLRILESLRDEAISIKNHAAHLMKIRYDKKVRQVEFLEGQEVLLFNAALTKQWSKKLNERWLGPY